jgi:hypothetical protein
MIIATMTATIFGTKVRVDSLMEVTAWKMLMVRPTTRLKIKSGEARRRMVSKVRRASCMTRSGVMDPPS